MIIISPYAQKLRNGKPNPKNYPFWKQVIQSIDEEIIQVGVEGEEQLVDDFRKNLSLSELCLLLHKCRTWVSCDSFFQHLAWQQEKKGIVLWSVSNPAIFGHDININLLKSKDCLAPNQFLWWEDTPFDPEKFVSPEEVIYNIKNFK